MTRPIPPHNRSPLYKKALTTDEREQIRSLILRGYSVRRIADKLGRSMPAVRRALRRRRRKAASRVQGRRMASRGVMPTAIAAIQLAAVEGRARRCPGCGGKVVMPCRFCALRAMKRANTKINESDFKGVA